MKKVSKQHSSIVHILVFASKFLPRFLQWYRTVNEIDPFIHKLPLFMVFYCSSSKLTRIPHKCKNLSLNFQPPSKRPCKGPDISVLMDREGRILGNCWPASLANERALDSVRDPASTEKVESDRTPVCPACTHLQAHLHIYTHIQKHVNMPIKKVK